MAENLQSAIANLKSDYTVLARRYRPQQFADVIGQEPVARALTNALESNRVAHAYLFTGARGVGKTSTARILAKALNCVRGPTPTPCDQCDICRGIATGEDVDVLEIDGASNRGIDEVREIRANVQFRPSRARHKIYIIDEVHMLTPAAFNALLKTLEEPPAHVKFIFATTEPQKIPVTILSRCQRFDFVGIGPGRIVEHLRGVVQAEGMEADDEALERIARRAGGSMRDAQSLLDQLLAFGDDRLTVEQVHRLLGTAPDDRVWSLAGAVLERDPKRALELLGQAVQEGVQLGELLDQLLDYWRDLMVVASAGPEAPDLSVPARHRETLLQQAAGQSLDSLLAGLDILAATKGRLRGSNHGRTLLEMALVRLARLENLVALSQLVQALEGAGKAATAPPAQVSSRPAVAPPTRPVTEPPEAVKKKPVPAPEPSAQALTPQGLPQIWPAVLAQVGPMLASQLEKAGLPAITGPNTLVVRFAPEYNSQREHCQEPASVERVEQVVRKLTGHPWRVRIESNGAAAAVRNSPAAGEPEPGPLRSQRLRMEAEREPLVQRALERLGAQVLHVDEGWGAAAAPSPDRAETADSEEPDS